MGTFKAASPRAMKRQDDPECEAYWFALEDEAAGLKLDRALFEGADGGERFLEVYMADVVIEKPASTVTVRTLAERSLKQRTEPLRRPPVAPTGRSVPTA